MPRRADGDVRADARLAAADATGTWVHVRFRDENIGGRDDACHLRRLAESGGSRDAFDLPRAPFGRRLVARSGLGRLTSTCRCCALNSRKASSSGVLGSLAEPNALHAYTQNAAL
jgi:hypothetical protein